MVRMPTIPQSQRCTTALLYLLFVLSGTASLIYEVVWKRSLMDLLGSASAATAMVLAVFMAGLGIGSWVAGRIADQTKRPIRVYALLEFGIVGLAMLPALESAALAPLFAMLARNWGPDSVVLDSARFVAAIVAIGPPTILMGATFPIIVRALVSQRELIGKQTASAYAANCLGGVCGTLLAGFLLIEHLGLRGAGLAAVGLSSLAGGLALWLDRQTGEVALAPPGTIPRSAEKLRVGKRWKRHKVKTADATSPLAASLRQRSDIHPRIGSSWILVAAGVAGFCALGYETLWVRVLSLMTLNTTFAFSLMLAILLFGLSVGSWLVRLTRDRLGHPAELFAGLQIALSAYAWSSLLWVPALGEFVSRMSSAGDVGFMQSWIGKPLLLAVCLLLLPACFMGASLPCLCQLYGTLTAGVGRPVGRVFAANSFGSVLGAIVVGLLIAPAFGTWWGIAGCSLLGALSAAGVVLAYVPKSRRIRYGTAAAVATLAAAVVGVIHGGSGIGRPNLNPNGIVIFRSEDAGGLVEVLEDSQAGTRWLLTNRLHWEGSTLPQAVAGQRQEALLPLLLHPSPRRVLEIGLGTGIKVGALDCPIVEKVVSVEISPAVIEASEFFADYNRAITTGVSSAKDKQSKIQILCGDGRNYVALTPEKFDLIVNGLLTPYRAGVSRLYTVEHFHACREKLLPEGMFVAWVAIRQIAPDDLKVLVRTLLEVFPHTTMWMKDHYLALISTTRPLTVDAEEIQRRFRDVSFQTAFDEAGVESPTALLANFVAGPEKLREFANGQPLNTDDRPIIEFRTPKLGKQLNTDRLGAKTIEMLAAVQESLCPQFVKADTEFQFRMDRAQQARKIARRAFILKCRGHHLEAAKQFQQALARDSEDTLARFELEAYLVAHGWQCLERGMTAQAQHVFQKALQINPQSISALASLATMEQAAGNNSGAIALWRLVRRIDPHYRPARRALAQRSVDGIRRQ